MVRGGGNGRGTTAERRNGEEHPLSPEPEPIDTSGVTPPEQLHDLIGVLARSAHDQWVRQRRAEGWTHGPRPDDGRKEHPLLVPYDQLPEIERARGRLTAADMVQAILALGYRIEKPARPADSSAGAADEEAARVFRRLRDPDPMDLAALLAIWEGRQPDRWAGAPEIYRLLRERTLKVGEPLLAHDVLATGLEVWPQDVRLRQLLGLALARTGASDRANVILLQLYREGHADEETLGILA